MKNIRNILLLITISFILGIGSVFATTLTIDSKSYNENTKEFKVSGSSSYSEVMVSLFDGDKLVSFKTTSTNNDKYDVTFSVTFDEDKEITIKVGDIESNNYKISTLNVKKTVEPTKPNKLTDDGGNTLTILDDLKKFDFEDSLYVEMITDFSEMSTEDQTKVAALQKALGDKKKLVGIMMVGVLDNNGDEKELEETNGKYELFLSIPENPLGDFKKPYAARLLDESTFKLEDGKELTYDSKEKGITINLNNTGVYILYDDVTVDYKFLENTGTQTYIIEKGNEITIKVDAKKDKFVGLYIDNKLIDEKNYTVKEGSTIITLKKDYLDTLTEGDHDVKVEFTDGDAIGKLTVKKEASIIDNITNPSTGDKIIMSVTLVLIGAVGLGITLKNSKKKRFTK